MKIYQLRFDGKRVIPVLFVHDNGHAYPDGDLIDVREKIDVEKTVSHIVNIDHLCKVHEGDDFFSFDFYRFLHSFIFLTTSPQNLFVNRLHSCYPQQIHFRSVEIELVEVIGDKISVKKENELNFK